MYREQETFALNANAKEWVVEEQPVEGTPFVKSRIRNVNTGEIQKGVEVARWTDRTHGTVQWIIKNNVNHVRQVFDAKFKLIEEDTIH